MVSEVMKLIPQEEVKYENPLDEIYVLRVNHLKTYYNTSRGAVKAVDDVTVWLRRGESLGIAGESGCGKTTLASSILNMVPPPGRIVGGEIWLDGIEISKLNESTLRREIRWKKVSMVFQGAMNALNPVYRVGYQMAEPLVYHYDMDPDEAEEIVKKYLELVGLSPAVAERYPHELSGGMKKRAGLARCFARIPNAILLDEPFTGLHSEARKLLWKKLYEMLSLRDVPVIVVTHYPGDVPSVRKCRFYALEGRPAVLKKL